MELAFSDLPLALFTTLAPMGAGAFIALALAFSTTKLAADQLRRIDRWTLLPLAVLLAGFAASFFHLANPLNAIHVFGHVGVSPLSNEILAGSLFVVLAFAYWAAATTGRLSYAARKVLACIVAAGALVFACFTGMAYVVPTIASWNTPLVPLSVMAFCVAGGVPLGTLVLALAGSDVFAAAQRTRFGMAAVVAAFAGVVVAFFAVTAHLAFVQSLYNAAVTGTVPLPDGMVYLLVVVVGLIVALAAERYTLMPPRKPGTDPAPKGVVGALVIANVGAVAGIFAGRLLFYALQVSVGL